ncbi:hypothetical protein [Rhodococcus sp. MALMAid1271]|uniref:hypothetical protein n=1 Tax=Rhodococcus sp. MALMAid1271 TaxID=3411744 RepID=UPI003BA304FD
MIDLAALQAQAERCADRFDCTRSDADAGAWARSIERLAAARTLPISAARLKALQLEVQQMQRKVS